MESIEVKRQSDIQIRLNLGSNKWKKEGWINIDLDPITMPDIVGNVVTLDAFASDIADEIYAGHILEHLDKEEARQALKRWKEVLKPGGFLHVVVPDIDKGLEGYYEIDHDWGQVELIAFGDPAERLLQAHKQLFNEERLLVFLTEAGFNGIRALDFDDEHLPVVANVMWQTGLTCKRPTE